MLRQLFFLINVIFWTTVLGMVAIIVGLFEPRGRFIGWLTRIWSRILLWASGVRYSVSGLEKLDRQSHYIFASNHESALDIPLILGGLPFHVVSLAKKELRRIPILGWVMVIARHIFVDRFNRKRAFESLEKVKSSLTENPRSLMIFPEGTRSKDGQVHQFKKGGLAIALEVGMDVVPLAVCGTGDIVAKKSFRLNRGQVELKVGEPILPADWEKSPKSDFADHVRLQVVIMKSLWEERTRVSSEVASA
ncbi:MAG: hypothetical protein CMG71_02265 [Candidatus Marinimicrobia bacterium]|nr:hypothetical protein [Candidatus Neomarinimicrobiota bacterium]